MDRLEPMTPARTLARHSVILAGLACASALLSGCWLSTANVADDHANDRSTPRRAYAGFTSACASGDFSLASSYMELNATSHDLGDGETLARELCGVIEAEIRVDPRSLSDRSESEPTSIATLVVDDAGIPITLDRSRSSDKRDGWRISRETVAAIPKLDAAFGTDGLARHVPEVLHGPVVLALAPWQWIGVVVLALVAITVGRVLARLVVRLLSRSRGDAPVSFGDHVAPTLVTPLRLVFAAALFRAAAPRLTLDADAWKVVVHALSVTAIIGIAWLASGISRGSAAWLRERILPDGRHTSPELRTQFAVLHRVVSVVAFVIASAAILLQFQIVRSVGTSLLASAGIAGLTIGFAAQKSLGAIIAGVQISIAQPIRIGDTVVVDGAQGVVEEIHLTYVVLRLPDDRRLVTPIGRFLDRSFENWTKLGSALLGYVTVPADFDIPLEPLRAELATICKKLPQWDGRACQLEVVDATADKGLQLQATVSAKDPGTLWELRCAVREALVAYLVRTDGGKHVVRSRTQMVS